MKDILNYSRGGPIQEQSPESLAESGCSRVAAWVSKAAFLWASISSSWLCKDNSTSLKRHRSSLQALEGALFPRHSEGAYFLMVNPGHVISSGLWKVSNFAVSFPGGQTKGQVSDHGRQHRQESMIQLTVVEQSQLKPGIACPGGLPCGSKRHSRSKKQHLMC